MCSNNPSMAPTGPIVSQADDCSGLGFDAKRKHGGREDEECAGARIDGLEQYSEQHHPDNVQDGSRVL